MHIHPSSPDASLFLVPEESAAVKIQAGFRGYRVRKHLQQNRKPKINGYINRSQRRSMLENTQKNKYSENPPAVNTSSNSKITSDEEEMQKCATKIQAGFRGFLVRKKQKIAADAATKIQAGFRGFKVRKDVEKLKQK